MKKKSIKNILVPVDFSPLSRQAIDMAKEVSRRFDSRIHLVHVHESYYPAGLMGPASPLPAALITFHQRAEEKLRAELAFLGKKNGIALQDCHLLSGTPTFEKVCLLARQLPADLIVMPTHAYKGITHFLEGSTAERIVQHAPCPVWVSRTPALEPRGTAKVPRLDQILVPIDFSRSSFAALEYAIGFAERCAARLIIFHAVHLGYAFTSDGKGMYDISALVDSTRKQAEKAMREFIRLAKFRRVPFETVVKVGPPVSAICSLAGQRKADLIIVSTHGRTGFKHVLMGSVAEQVVRYAAKPVLVVPAHPDVRAARLPQPKQNRRRSKSPMANRLATHSLPAESERFTKRFRKTTVHPFPERRRTNKFRQTRSSEPGK